MSEIEIFFLVSSIIIAVVGIAFGVLSIKSHIKNPDNYYSQRGRGWRVHFHPIFCGVLLLFVGVVGISGIVMSITGAFSDMNIGTTPNGKIYFYHEDTSYSYPDEIEYMGKTYILATETVEVTEELCLNKERCA